MRNLPSQQWFSLVGAASLISVFIFVAVEYGPFRQAENKFSDLRLSLMAQRQPAPEEIVVLTITEETLAQFPYRSPINRHFLAKLIRLLNERGVRAIGIDVLLDSPSDPEADKALESALRASRVPVVLAYTDEELLTESQQQFLDQFTSGPGRMRGYANVLLDGADGVVRQAFAGRVAPDGTFTWGFAAAIAQQMGAIPPTETVPLHYRGIPPDAPADDLTSAFKHYPSHLAEHLPAAWIKDKAVLIGAELPASSEDMKKTPFAALLGNAPGMLPGVMIHAHAIMQMVDDIHIPTLSPFMVLLVYLLTTVVGVFLTRLRWSPWIILLLIVGVVHICWAINFLHYRYLHFSWPLLGPSLVLLSTTWWALAYASRQEHKQKLFIKSAFARYLDPYWVDQLIAHPDLLQLQGERRQMTLLFSDIAGFTTLSERLPPETLVKGLRRYLDGMTQVIMAHGGTVNQYMGDGILALFGAPAKQPDHALRAVQCALALNEFAEVFRDTVTLTDRTGQEVQFGHTRIGVHTGEAIVGNFGSSEKLEYTAIGDTVNTASRLEGLNSHFGTRVAVSETTRKAALRDVPADVPLYFRTVAQVVVKGKNRPLGVCQPLPPGDPACHILDAYEAAYLLLQNHDAAAKAAFLDLHEVAPNDPLVSFHLHRISSGEVSTYVKMVSK